LENYDRLDSFGNWTLSDFIDELHVDDNLFHGGMGTFTRNGIKKPAYYAFYFLNQLQDILLKRGEGYFVTTDGQGRYTILLYNYSHYTGLYAQGILFDGSPESRYEAFGEMISMDIELTLDKIPSGRYHLKEQIVNRSYGSCYDEWVRMGAEPLDTPEELSLLKARSVPMMIKNTLDVCDDRMVYYANLEPLEIRLAQITPCIPSGRFDTECLD
jgi:xylan 1,4-beta-xylosidase